MNVSVGVVCDMRSHHTIHWRDRINCQNLHDSWDCFRSARPVATVLALWLRSTMRARRTEARRPASHSPNGVSKITTTTLTPLTNTSIDHHHTLINGMPSNTSDTTTTLKWVSDPSGTLCARDSLTSRNTIGLKRCCNLARIQFSITHLDAADIVDGRLPPESRVVVGFTCTRERQANRRQKFSTKTSRMSVRNSNRRTTRDYSRDNVLSRELITLWNSRIVAPCCSRR